jgi:hypothetical protein
MGDEKSRSLKMPVDKDKLIDEMVDIVSQALVAEESRYVTARDEGRFYSNHLVNRMRDVFGLPPLPRLEGKN